VRFQAGDPIPSDERVVARPGGELEAVPDHQSHGIAGRRQAEQDGPGGHDDDLVVGMVMGTVSITRAVRPRSGRKTLSPKALLKIDRGHMAMLGHLAG